MNRILFSFFIVSLPHFAFAANFECTNSQILQTPIVLGGDQQSWLIEDPSEQVCHFFASDEQPTETNYEGWLKLVPIASTKLKCMQLVDVFKLKPRKIEHLILSDEIQNGKTGFAQIAFESSGQEHGPKIIKTFLKCFPKS